MKLPVGVITCVLIGLVGPSLAVDPESLENSLFKIAVETDQKFIDPVGLVLPSSAKEVVGFYLSAIDWIYGHAKVHPKVAQDLVEKAKLEEICALIQKGIQTDIESISQSILALDYACKSYKLLRGNYKPSSSH